MNLTTPLTVNTDYRNYMVPDRVKSYSTLEITNQEIIPDASFVTVSLSNSLLWCSTEAQSSQLCSGSTFIAEDGPMNLVPNLVPHYDFCEKLKLYSCIYIYRYYKYISIYLFIY